MKKGSMKKGSRESFVQVQKMMTEKVVESKKKYNRKNEKKQ